MEQRKSKYYETSSFSDGLKITLESSWAAIKIYERFRSAIRNLTVDENRSTKQRKTSSFNWQIFHSLRPIFRHHAHFLSRGKSLDYTYNNFLYGEQFHFHGFKSDILHG